MDDFDIETENTGNQGMLRLKAILLAIVFPFIMGGLLGSIIQTNSIEKLSQNPSGFVAVLAITSGATILIWAGGFYQALKKGHSFGMRKNIWTTVVIGGHLLGFVLGYIFM